MYATSQRMPTVCSLRNPQSNCHFTHYSPLHRSGPACGTLLLRFDSTTNLLDIDVSFSGLSGVMTVSRIHCCTGSAGTGTAGVAVTPVTLPGFPVGASSESYVLNHLNLLDTAGYTAAFVTASGGNTAFALSRLLANMESGNADFNIHSSAFSGGEIRGVAVWQSAKMAARLPCA